LRASLRTNGFAWLLQLVAAADQPGNEGSREHSCGEDNSGGLDGFAAHHALAIVDHVFGRVTALFDGFDRCFESVFDGLSDGIGETGNLAKNFVNRGDVFE
jgi:hypothetical protein